MPEVQSNPEAIRDSVAAKREFRDRTQKRLSLNWASQSNSNADPAPETPANVESKIPEDQSAEEDAAQLAQQLGVEDVEESDEETSDDAEASEAKGLEATEDADEGESDAADDAEESEPEEGSIEYVQRELEQAIEARESMQKDYTRKTQAVADLRRDVEELAAVTLTENSFYVNQAENRLKQQFANVDFANLRVTDPARYEKVSTAYTQLAKVAEQAKLRHQHLQTGFEERLEAVKEREAELSRSILKSTVPDWSDERVAELRQFAVEELGFYDDDSFNELTDWRPIVLLDRLHKTRVGPKSVKELRKKQSKRPKAAANRKAKPLRNEKGQFVKSREAAFQQPGNRNALNQSFRDRLAAERVAGGPLRY